MSVRWAGRRQEAAHEAKYEDLSVKVKFISWSGDLCDTLLITDSEEETSLRLHWTKLCPKVF